MTQIYRVRIIDGRRVVMFVENSESFQQYSYGEPIPTKEINVHMGRLADDLTPGTSPAIILIGRPLVLRRYASAASAIFSAGTRLHPKITPLGLSSGLEEALINTSQRIAQALMDEPINCSHYDLQKGADSPILQRVLYTVRF